MYMKRAQWLRPSADLAKDLSLMPNTHIRQLTTAGLRLYHQGTQHLILVPMGTCIHMNTNN